jgi:hypothetical protein
MVCILSIIYLFRRYNLYIAKWRKEEKVSKREEITILFR